jgi:hypothetical protein
MLGMGVPDLPADPGGVIISGAGGSASLYSLSIPSNTLNGGKNHGVLELPPKPSARPANKLLLLWSRPIQRPSFARASRSTVGDVHLCPSAGAHRTYSFVAAGHVGHAALHRFVRRHAAKYARRRPDF